MLPTTDFVQAYEHGLTSDFFMIGTSSRGFDVNRKGKISISAVIVLKSVNEPIREQWYWIYLLYIN